MIEVQMILLEVMINNLLNIKQAFMLKYKNNIKVDINAIK